MAPIPGSSYAHKNMRKFIYYSLNSDHAEELPAFWNFKIFLPHSIEVSWSHIQVSGIYDFWFVKKIEFYLNVTSGCFSRSISGLRWWLWLAAGNQNKFPLCSHSNDFIVLYFALLKQHKMTTQQSLHTRGLHARLSPSCEVKSPSNAPAIINTIEYHCRDKNIICPVRIFHKSTLRQD
jgi:hypothetical protein